MKRRLLWTLKKLLSYIPTPLPVGISQFNTFADSVIELSGGYADKDSMKFAVASMIIHADHKVASLSKNYFVIRLRKSAANQIASQVFQDIKTKQEQQLKAAEVTAATTKASDQSGQTAVQ